MTWLINASDCLILKVFLLLGSGVLLIADSWSPRRKRG